MLRQREVSREDRSVWNFCITRRVVYRGGDHQREVLQREVGKFQRRRQLGIFLFTTFHQKRNPAHLVFDKT